MYYLWIMIEIIVRIILILLLQNLNDFDVLEIPTNL